MRSVLVLGVAACQLACTRPAPPSSNATSTPAEGISSPSSPADASDAEVAHPSLLAMPAAIRPGMTLAEFVRLHHGLAPRRITASEGSPTTRMWSRPERLYGFAGNWTFEFRAGLLAGYTFQPDSAIHRADRREPWSEQASCEMGYGEDQFAACVRASRALIADLSGRYGSPLLATGVQHAAEAASPGGRRAWVVNDPTCALAYNVITATWNTTTARFRHVLWLIESKGEPEYLWAFVVIGPRDRFEDVESVHPVC